MWIGWHVGGEPRKTPPHCLWFLLHGWAVVPPAAARPRVGCVCVCVCVCVCMCKLSPEDGHRALGMGSPWPGSLLTPANRAWAFLVPPTHPPTSCWQRSGHVLLQPLTQARVIWKSS